MNHNDFETILNVEIQSFEPYNFRLKIFFLIKFLKYFINLKKKYFMKEILIYLFYFSNNNNIRNEIKQNGKAINYIFAQIPEFNFRNILKVQLFK